MGRLKPTQKLNSRSLSQSYELRLVKYFLIASALIHIGVFIVDISSWLSWTPKPPQEWVIDAELSFDQLADNNKDAFTKAKQADSIKVREQILPQLPKQFKIEEQKSVADSSEKAPDSEILPKEKEEIKEPEKPEEKQKPEPISQPSKAEDTEKAKLEEHRRQQIQERALAELKKKDAIERLLKERARKNKQFAKEDESPLNDSLLERQKELATRSNGMQFDSDSLNQYNRLLKNWVQKHYSLPEIYANVEGQTLAVIEIILSDKGELQKMHLLQSSRNKAFDKLALKAMENAAPFPKPPKELVGIPIHYRFDNKTL